MYRIFDAHAHIYPEKIAVKASAAIGDFYHIPMHYDGTVSSLLALAKEKGISRFLVHSVATTEHQVTAVNDFIAAAVQTGDGRFTGFATLHPDFANPGREIARVRALALKGVKLHPDFQRFSISDRRMDAAYAAMQEMSLPVLFHTGDKRYDWSSPKHIPILRARFPRLKIICAHFGGYTEWDEAERILAGEGVYVDTSSSIPYLGVERARALIAHYGEDRVLFGSDYPMWDTGEEVARLLTLGLPDATVQKILYDNAAALLDEA